MSINGRGNMICLIIALILILPNILYATPPDDNTTPTTIGVTSKGWEISTHQYNGRFWNKLEEYHKPAFVSGFFEGVIAYCVSSGVLTTPEQDKYSNLEDSYVSTKLSPPEIASIIDDIYKDKSNIRIPVSEVLRVAIKKAGGLSNKRVENLLSELRQRYLK